MTKTLETDLAHPVVNVSVDGGIMSLQTPLRLKVREGGLKVLAPTASA